MNDRFSLVSDTMLRFYYLILLCVFLNACDNESVLVEGFIGVDQSYLIKEFGEPDEIEELLRNEEHVLGAIEDLWYKIEMGEKIVIWKYVTHDGWRELYFLNDSTEVAGEFRWYDDLK